MAEHVYTKRPAALKWPVCREELRAMQAVASSLATSSICWIFRQAPAFHAQASSFASTSASARSRAVFIRTQDSQPAFRSASCLGTGLPNSQFGAHRSALVDARDMKMASFALCVCVPDSAQTVWLAINHARQPSTGARTQNWAFSARALSGGKRALRNSKPLAVATPVAGLAA